jgi:predicted ArsR family transcriptional regulator
VKRYEISYANQVLDVLVITAAGEATVEMSVRQIADETGLSASAVQLGLQALRRSGRVQTLRKGAAGRPSLLEIRSEEPIEGAEAGSERRGGSQLADAFIKRYEELLLDLHAKTNGNEVEHLRAKVAELEAENAELRTELARLARLTEGVQTEESA